MNHFEELKQVLIKGEVLENEPLAKHTTFRIGGPASIYAIPATAEELKNMLSYCARTQLKYYVLGKGSNTLFSDEGFDGVVIEVGKGLEDVTFLNDTTVKAQAGISLAKLAHKLLDKELTGFEFASGIPGTLGGAVVMNAGAYGGEIKDCIVEACVIDEFGYEKILSRDELELGYRTSIVQQKKYFVIWAILEFQKGNKDEIQGQMKKLNARRKEKQPLEYGSAGSTFKRPEGYFAGKLIQDSGLRGYRIGDAMVSEKHCGFVVNVGNATAEDVLSVISHVQKTVKDMFQVELETEVRLIQ